MVGKRALQKDIFREIRHTFGRFFSIFAIALLGVAFFTGIRVTSPDMKESGDAFFDDMQTMDIQLLSTVGFEQTDIDAIRQTANVEGVMASHQVDAIMETADKDMVVKVMALPGSENGADQLNLPYVIEGRLPQADNECVVDNVNAFHENGQIGDTITLVSGTDDPITDSLKTDTYTIVGRVISPLYVSMERGSSTVGDGTVSSFIMVPDSAFEMDVYTVAYVRVAGAEDLMCYDDAYADLLAPVAAELETLGEQRGAQWEADTRAEAEQEIADAEKELDDAERKASAAFADAQKQIDDNKKQIEDGYAALKDGRAQLKQTLAEKRAEIAQGREQLAAGEAEYQAQKEQFEQLKPMLPPEQVAAGEAALAEARAKLDATQKQLDDGEAALNKTEAETTAQMDEKEKQLKDGEAELVKAQNTLNREKADAEKEIRDGRQEIADARAELDEIPQAKWYVSERTENSGYSEYSQTADRMAAIGEVFPAVFFLIAALVCLTTMTRMVDEQRGNIGTLKALGYGKGAIASKYLVYAVLASALGSVVGFFGMQIFPQIIIQAYEVLFVIPNFATPFRADYAAVAAGIAVGVTVLAALLACLSQLHDTPATLLRPKAPKAGKLILLERIGWLWKRFNFSTKVTARNLFRYKKRFWMTVIGVAGCTALLLTGFGIRDSIDIVSKKQFEELNHYALTLTIGSEEPGDVQAAMDAVAQTPGVAAMMPTFQKNYTVHGAGTQEDLYVLALQDDAKTPDFFTLRTVEGEPIAWPQQGVVLTDKVARLLGVGVGDTVEIEDGARRMEVQVSALAENYLQHYAFMTNETYTALFGQAVQPNNLRVQAAEGADEDALSRQLLQIDDVAGVNRTEDMVRAFDDMIASMNSVMWVLIISAGLLAFVVLYNLTTINIGERTREIATLKVLGFNRREVAGYVFRENAILTVIGILAGFALGVVLHGFVMATVEVDLVVFGRQIKAVSYLIATALTAAFAILVNLVMLRRLKNIDMVESLKTVE